MFDMKRRKKVAAITPTRPQVPDYVLTSVEHGALELEVIKTIKDEARLTVEDILSGRALVHHPYQCQWVSMFLGQLIEAGACDELVAHAIRTYTWEMRHRGAGRIPINAVTDQLRPERTPAASWTPVREIACR